MSTMSTMSTLIKSVTHTAVGGDPAGLGLALEVARELHPPVARAPEVATTAAARSSRRSPARRRTVVRG